MVFLNFSNTYQTYVSYGKIGLYLFIVLWFTSAVVRKSLNYRSWLYVHYISYPMLFFVLLHPLQIGSYLQEYSLIYNYWIFIIIASFVFMIIKLSDILNLSSFKYRINEIKNYPGDIFTIKYSPQSEKFLRIKPGQYFYIKKDFIGESHPFSILEYNDDTGEVIFGIKKLGRYSTLLGNSKVGDTHYIDGPFGEFTFEAHNNSPKVILAGGIGITPFYEVLSQFGTDDSYLFYANKNTDSALYRDKFKEMLRNNYFDFVEQKEGEKNNVFCELISAQKIKQLLQHKNLDELKYFICGSPGFTKNMINCLQTLGINRSNIYIEEFEY
jgi:predicted ferric reductase